MDIEYKRERWSEKNQSELYNRYMIPLREELQHLRELADHAERNSNDIFCLQGLHTRSWIITYIYILHTVYLYDCYVMFMLF